MPNNSKRVSEEFPELFHYTTVEAFKNIYKERKFWATHYENLNDSSELGQFKKKLSESIQPLIREKFEEKMRNDSQFSAKVNSSGGIDAVVVQEAVTQVDIPHQLAFGERGLPETFICSFCTHKTGSYEAKHGLLSQWRGYGTGGGVAIVLDTRFIERRMQHEKDVFAHPINHIGDVKYDNNKDDAKIKKEFREVFDYLPKMICANYSGEKVKIEHPEKVFDRFVLGSTLVKHHGFHEEKEVRIVVSLWPTNPNSIFNIPVADAIPPKDFKKIKYRPRCDSEVRYIELFGDKDLPITRIIVGPSRFQNFNFQTISELVKDDPRDIEVVKSGTPFLG